MVGGKLGGGGSAACRPPRHWVPCPLWYHMQDTPGVWELPAVPGWPRVTVLAAWDPRELRAVWGASEGVLGWRGWWPQLTWGLGDAEMQAMPWACEFL